MIHFTLERTTQDSEATCGRIVDDGGREVCKTLERPWLDNKHNVSCIPAGEYTAHRYFSPKRHFEVFMLDDVPGRSAIEIHVGNVPLDTDGCILLGMRFGRLGDQTAVLSSREAFDLFMSLVKHEDGITLTVKDP